MGRPKTTTFTEAELRCLVQRALGETNASAGAKLNLSYHTVKGNVRRMLTRHDLPSGPALVNYGFATGVLQDRVPPPRHNRSVRLPARQRDVLLGIADGLTYVQIARRHTINVETVRTTASRLLRRLGARNAEHAVTLSWQLGLLGDSGPLDGTDALDQLFAEVA